MIVPSKADLNVITAKQWAILLLYHGRSEVFVDLVRGELAEDGEGEPVPARTHAAVVLAQGERQVIAFRAALGMCFLSL